MFKYSIFVIIAAMTVNVAIAAMTIYVPAWSQDFEDPQTYANELWHGRVQCSLLGTTALELQSLAEWGYYTVFAESYSPPSNADCNCIISPETRTRQINGVDAGDSTYMRGFMRSIARKRDTDLVFRLPDEVVAAINEGGSYAVDFDYYLAPSYSNGTNTSSKNTATNGLVVATVDGNAIAVFGTQPNGGSKVAEIGEIYTADSPEALAKDGIAVGGRGSNDTEGLWMHVSLHAASDGVTMDVIRENGIVLLSGARLTNSFVVIDRLYLHSHVDSYSANVCLDNVTVSRGVQIADEDYYYTWTNGGGDGKWENAANWCVDGLVGVAAPGVEDTAVFPADGAPWSVTLDSAETVSNFVANGAVSLSGALVYALEVGGSAKITLAGNAGFHTASTAKDAVLSITNDIAITGTGNKFQTYGSDHYMEGGKIRVTGNVTGDGEISFTGKRSLFELCGDWMDFAGTVNVVNDGIPRNGTTIETPLATSSNAVWNVYHSSASENFFLRSGSQRYYFGALNGYIFQKTISYDSWLEIGALGIDSSFGGQLGATRQNHIEKVGPAKLTWTGSDLGNVTIREGTFVFGGANSMARGTIRFAGEGMFAVTAFKEGTSEFLDPSPHLANSIDEAICFSNSVGEVHVWETALSASNTGGLVKLGEGTLVLAQPPQYEGETTVREGRLVVSNANEVAITPGPATCLTIDGFGTATLEPPPPGTVAMAGTVPYADFETALGVCLADPSLTLTLLAPAYDISLPVGASIHLRPDGHEYSFAAADRCRIDKENQNGDIIICRHVWDIVTLMPPDIDNASLETASTNGVSLVRDGGLYFVLRGERVDFSWTEGDGYLLNTNAVTMIAGEDVNAVPAESLPFAMSVAEIEEGNILRLMDVDGVAAQEFTARAGLATLSVEAQSTAWTMRLDARLDISNIVFTLGAHLDVRPGVAFGDGGTLIAWQVQHSLDGFALAPEFIADGWVIRSEPDGLKLYKASRCSVNGKIYSSMERAFAESSDGDTIRLELDSWLFDRIDIPSGETRTLDLGGHRLNVASFWAVNVGDACCMVTNGEIVCQHCGFYVTDGMLALNDCRVQARGRVAQVRGSGTVDIASDVELTTDGDDPVVFAIGGFGGRARVVSRGEVRQLSAAAGDATTSCIAGNGDDTFGADFALASDSGAYMTSSVAGIIYHPEMQGGDVEISGGWFSSQPQDEWLAASVAMRQEMLDDIPGWRVFMPMPPADNAQSIAGILSESADAANLLANIVTPSEYGFYRDWVGRHSSFGAMQASRFAWIAYALDAPVLIPREAPLKPEEIQIEDFTPLGDDGTWTVVVGLKDIEIGNEAEISRLVKVFGLTGGTSLEPESFSGDNVRLATDASNADAAEVDGGKLKLVVKPATPVDDSFFLRLEVKNKK